MTGPATTTQPISAARAADDRAVIAVNRPIKEPRADRVLNTLMIIILSLIGLSIVYPFVFIASASVSSTTAVDSGQVWLWPVGINLDAYKVIFEYPDIIRGFLNSIFYSGAVMVIGTFITVMGGYAMSRKDMPGRGIFMIIFVITMLFSGGMIPTYLVVRDLHMLDTVWAMILPSAMSVWQLIVSRTYFQVTIPQELLESSQLDGATDFRFFFQIVVPLSKPIIAVNCLLFAVGTWNSFFNALIYLTNTDLYPLQLVMRNILLQNTFDPSKMTGVDPAKIAEMQQIADKLKYALILIASIPPLIAYPFVQKHFVKGMMIGSLKG